ncbi:SH3 domain-containing protein [Phaeobacter marinintestinus]|uniref:SH3 domain-containing protein n=1 Tax=Falsiphaeobacter marinintestinus TaxID=1492905 RepID=UPI001FEA79EA|nr:SH3 domain-containing protein [Phaeobacter marinintestinus]
MARFIVVTFLFMGIAFYQLSGGSDFEPRGVRAEKTAAVSSSVSAPTPIQVSDAEPVLAPRKDGQAAATPSAAPKPDTAAIEAAVRLAKARVSLSDGLTLLGDQNSVQGLQLASLSEGVIGLRTAPTEETETSDEPATQEYTSPEPDIREVKGTRVNMRHGPGTNYEVVTSLTLGHEVEVLSDSGTGWLRLRTRPEGTMGWISASLIAKKTQ